MRGFVDGQFSQTMKSLFYFVGLNSLIIPTHPRINSSSKQIKSLLENQDAFIMSLGATNDRDSLKKCNIRIFY